MALYSAVSDFVTGRTLVEGDRAVCIVLHLLDEPKAAYYPTDMAVAASLPMFGRIGEDDGFVPNLDDFAADMFGHTVGKSWKTMAELFRRGPVRLDVERTFSHEMVLAPAYVAENTFHRIAAMAAPDEDQRQQEVWNSAQILHDALVRSRKNVRDEAWQDARTVAMMDSPIEDEWEMPDGRLVQVPDLMRRFNDEACRIHTLAKLAFKDTLRACDNVFEVEVGYSRFHQLRSFAAGLFMLGRQFQPSRRAGNMNLVESASFMIGEIQHILASAHLEPAEIEELKERLQPLLSSAAAMAPGR